ncbi:hypothetical protein BFJ65_g9412 [Fusarium oxysporum f. sp. cepae]|uniref:Uncharacterized protein n=1 Tax=Fusarium oxysporum f. sp. cepae TaxID=396571 RepID=A0A3L6NEG9_FUSOX|nr:hypothetical protein BFJ65_g9412 [Fusarium oxysporum f. sp. cepae]
MLVNGSGICSHHGSMFGKSRVNRQMRDVPFVKYSRPRNAML